MFTVTIETRYIGFGIHSNADASECEVTLRYQRGYMENDTWVVVHDASISIPLTEALEFLKSPGKISKGAPAVADAIRQFAEDRLAREGFPE